MTEPLKLTLVIADNPLRGLPGQNDVVITVSGDPDIPLGPGGVIAPEAHDRLLESPAFCAAVAALAHVAGLAHGTVLMSMPWGGSS